MGNVYPAIATATGRDGRAVTSDGKLDLDLSLPVEMGGDGVGTNPEQLFAAGYAACFATSMKLVAPRKNLDVSDASVTAEVDLAPNGAGGYKLDVTLQRSEEHTSELQSLRHLVCRLLLEKKNE